MAGGACGSRGQSRSLLFSFHGIARLNGRFIDRNQGWNKTLGYIHQVLNSKPFLDVIAPDGNRTKAASSSDARFRPGHLLAASTSMGAVCSARTEAP